MGIRDVLLVEALERQPLGTQMAGAYVDDDGTATVELLERTRDGWRNITTRSTQTLTHVDMARRYDDVVLTKLA